MRIHKVVQGSPEWLALRAAHNCASDAPVMMGASTHTKRSELVRMKATGDEREFSEWAKKNLLEKGHLVEADIRPIVEEMIGEDLFPVTGSDELNRGITTLLASFDGITMGGKTGFEHKLWNAELAEAMRGGVIPPMYYWQLEHQILVAGLERVIFVCSNGTREKMLHLEYRPLPGLAQKLLAGWKQFEEDVRNYKHVEVIPAAKGRAIRTLPIISMQVVGKVKSSNLAEYRTSALQFIAAINTDLQTDQDFADAAETVKFCEDAEKKLEEAKARALAETATVAEAFAMIDEVKAAMRAKRLSLDKLVEARKQSLRAEILKEGVDAFCAHVRSLNQRLGEALMPPHVPVDFAGAMKGKKTIASLRDAVATTLAHGKIAANEIADRIGVNLNTLRSLAGEELAFLFPDRAQIVQKGLDDFVALVKTRIAEHKELERKRQEAAAQSAAQSAIAVAATVLATEKPGPVATPRNVVQLRAPARPSDREIVTALAACYLVPEKTALEWLRTFDFNAASEAFATAHTGD